MKEPLNPTVPNPKPAATPPSFSNSALQSAIMLPLPPATKFATPVLFTVASPVLFAGWAATLAGSPLPGTVAIPLPPTTAAA